MNKVRFEVNIKLDAIETLLVKIDVLLEVEIAIQSYDVYPYITEMENLDFSQDIIDKVSNVSLGQLMKRIKIIDDEIYLNNDETNLADDNILVYTIPCELTIE